MNAVASASLSLPSAHHAPSWVTLDPMLADDFPRA